MNNNFKITNKNGVVYFRSTEISTPHGFSTRKGGVSKQSHLSEMNLGKNLGDDPSAVAENYRRMGMAIGFDPESIVFTNQIHSSIVLPVTKSDTGKTYDCDGFVTAEPGVTLAVRTADCVPILLFDPVARVVGGVHAGWRGTAGRIQQNAVNEMKKLGTEEERIKVGIGACIHKCCYRVGEDYRKALYEQLGSELTNTFVTEKADGLYSDLVGLNRALLTEAGVLPENIDICEECTCCKPELFFSHRATGGKRGVMSAFICL